MLLNIKFNPIGFNQTGLNVPIINSEKMSRFYGLRLELKGKNSEVTIFNQTSQIPQTRAVSNGMLTDLIIYRQFNERLSYPYSNCIDHFSLSQIFAESTDKTQHRYISWKCRSLAKMKSFNGQPNITTDLFKSALENYSNTIKFIQLVALLPRDNQQNIGKYNCVFKINYDIY